jgi:hypothetical protein|eukprot:scaffold712_cov255-Chaetoceros_neogracile.AAC.18
MSLRVPSTSIIDEDETYLDNISLIDNAETKVPKNQSKLRITLINLIDHIESHLNSLNGVPYKMQGIIYKFKHMHYLLYGILAISMLVFLIQNGPSKQFLSIKESLGLLQIPDVEWSRLKSLYERTERHKFDKDSFIDDPNVWYQYNYPVDFVCPNAERVGKISEGSQTNRNEDYDGYIGGGKWMCNPRGIVDIVRQRIKRTKLQKFTEFFGHKYEGKNGCLIYSIGVNGNGLHFENSIQRMLTEEAGTCKKKGHRSCNQFCEIHVFDPAGYHQQVLIEDGTHYHDFGIVSSASEARISDDDGDIKGEQRSHQRFKSFQEAVKELGHQGHVIDIMKVDCKMCEWGIYDDWFDHDDPATESHRGHGQVGVSMVQQLLVEVHGTPQEYVNEFFERMEDENYVIFHKDSDTQTFHGMSQDYAFLKLDKRFFPS